MELLARRFSLEAVWALRGGSVEYQALLTRLGAPGPALTQRLRELREAGLIEVDEAGAYRLTPSGRRLQGALNGLDSYAQTWASMTPRQRRPKGASDRGVDEP